MCLFQFINLQQRTIQGLEFPTRRKVRVHSRLSLVATPRISQCSTSNSASLSRYLSPPTYFIWIVGHPVDKAATLPLNRSQGRSSKSVEQHASTVSCNLCCCTHTDVSAAVKERGPDASRLSSSFLSLISMKFDCDPSGSKIHDINIGTICWIWERINDNSGCRHCWRGPLWLVCRI
jgi:hypothetical protein